MLDGENSPFIADILTLYELVFQISKSPAKRGSFIGQRRNILIKFISMSKYFEVKRKTVHFLFGLFVAVLIYFDLFYLPFWMTVLAIMLFIALVLMKNYRESWISRFIVSLEREEEMERLPLLGVLTFISGCILSFVLFDSLIAILAIIALFLGIFF